MKVRHLEIAVMFLMFLCLLDTPVKAGNKKQCGCKVTIEQVHNVDGDMCPENEVMVGHPEDTDHHQVACGKVVCHCSCSPDKKD